MAEKGNSQKSQNNAKKLKGRQWKIETVVQ